MPQTVHSLEAIEAILRRGATPTTDNREALIALGFVRSSPHKSGDHDEKIWERSVDRAERSISGHRVMVRERAILEAEPNLN